MLSILDFACVGKLVKEHGPTSHVISVQYDQDDNQCRLAVFWQGSKAETSCSLFWLKPA